MVDTTTVGILGAGHIGSVHLQSARTIDGIAVEAVADASAANRRRAKKLGAPTVYDEYEALIRSETLDVIVVALPPFLHADAAELAIDAGSHVFVEKPFARTVSEGRALVDAAHSAGVSIGVDHSLRYQEDIRKLKRTYDRGTLGTVPLCYASRINNGPFDSPPERKRVSEWALDPEATGGGAVMDLGIHLLDVLDWFFGDLEVRHVELDRQLELEYEDTASITLRSNDSGTIVTLNCGYYQWENLPEVNLTIRLDGVTKTARSEDFVPDFYRHAGRSALSNVLKRATGRPPDYFGPSYYYRAHYAALEAFLEAVQAGSPPPVSGADGIRALELVHEVYERADPDIGTRDGEATARTSTDSR